MFAAFASRAKRVVEETMEGTDKPSPLIMCTGGFRSKQGMLAAVRQDGIDLIGLARASAVEPLLAQRLLESAAIDAACPPYQVTGGEWLQMLIPSPLVGASVTTLWHQMQMLRTARGEMAQLGFSFERLLLAESWHAFTASRTFLIVIYGIGLYVILATVYKG